MERCRTAHGAGSARSLLAHTILLFCTGWILNLVGEVGGAPLIKHGGGEGENVNGIIIDSQPIVHQLVSGNDVRVLTEGINTNTNRDHKTDSKSDIDDSGAPPVILLPDNIIHALHHEYDNNKNETEELHETIVGNREDDSNLKKPVVIVMEYQPNLVIRCAATGSPKPNVSWEYEDGTLPHYVATNSLTYGHGYIHSIGEDVDGEGLHEAEEEKEWIDLKLPKLNNAFYGKLRCRAVNVYGNTTWEMELVHNSNSSVLMKGVRCALAGIFLIAAIFVVKGFLWVEHKRQEKLYERLPPQDVEIIKKFKKGLAPPPPSPCSSIIAQEKRHNSLISGATSCIKSIEITVTGVEEDENSKGIPPENEGYRPVNRGSSTPDLQQRLINSASAGTSITSSSSHILDAVNSWTNYVPYDDKLETSSQHFSIDLSKIMENGSYGMVYAGKVRDDLTMEWSTVAVKTGKTEKDENCMLESTLTELKILASLPKPHENILNLKGAYTKMLHKRQTFVFVDYCEHGTLANFIDLNRGNFLDVFMISPEETAGGEDNFQDKKIIPFNNDTDNHAITFTAKSDDVTINHELKNDKVVSDYQITHKDLLVWAWQIADGVNFLHKNRVIHGNLSTSNIYMTSKFKIKIGNIGYSPMMHQEPMDGVHDETKKWLSVPHYCYEQFSKRSDIWEYGRVLWEIFSLREQTCPDNGRIVDFTQNDYVDGDGRDEEGFEIPQFATQDMFELMLCCWNDNATLCPEFDFFVKSFKKLYKEVAVLTKSGKDKSLTG